jgi:hypothetical protein
MQDNYKTIERKLKELESFNGNTLTARVEKTWGTFSYKVYSYNTLIAEKYWDGMEGEWFTRLNDTKYSVTTSKHQNIIRRAWGLK